MDFQCLAQHRLASSDANLAARTLPVRPREDPAERTGYLRYFYRGWRPTRIGRLWSRGYAWVSGLGLLPGLLLTLLTNDRTNGRASATILVVCTFLKAWVQVATSGRHHLPVSPDAPIPAFEAIAGDYPVFRIDQARDPGAPDDD